MVRNMVQSMQTENCDLSEFYIFSSHNSYCKNYQIENNLEECNIGLEPIRYLLDTYKGGCIELDVAQPLGRCEMAVCHSGFPGVGYKTPLKLTEVIEDIIAWSDQHIPHFPIILSLDLKRRGAQDIITLDRVFRFCFKDNSNKLFPNPQKMNYQPYIDKLTLSDTMNCILLKINSDIQPHIRFLRGRVAFPRSPLFLSTNNWATCDITEREIQPMYRRIYPVYAYILSHNFNPVPFWEVGVQMVALNMQRNDMYTYIYHKLFNNRPYIHKSEWPKMKKKIKRLIIQYKRSQSSPRHTEISKNTWKQFT